MLEVATITFAEGNSPRYGLVVGGFLYIACWDWSGGIAKVVKIDLSAFTYVSALTIYNADGRASGLAASGGYLYCGVGQDPGHIVKVNIATFSVEATLDMVGYPSQVMGLATDSSYVYATPYQSGDPIWKIDLSTFTEVDSAVSTGGSGKHPLIYDSHLYYISGQILKKATISPLAEIATLGLGVAYHDDACIARIGGFIFTTENGDPSRMCKVDLSTFTKVDELALSSPSPQDIVASNGFLYTCHYFSNKVIKIDPDSLSEADEITLSGSANNIRVIAANPNLYIGSNLSPGRVTKVTDEIPVAARKGNIVIDQLIYQHAERMRR